MVAMAMLGAVGGGRVRSRLTQGRRDGGGLDGDDAGVHDLTVHLHHHLVTLRRVVEALWGGGGGVSEGGEARHAHPDAPSLTVDRHGGHHQGHLGPAGLVVADGGQQQVVLGRHTCTCECVQARGARAPAGTPTLLKDTT